MNKKTVDHGPTAYNWGIAVGFGIAWFMCEYYPKDASWRQDILLGVGIVAVIILTPTIWLPSPEKTEKEEKESK